MFSLPLLGALALLGGTDGPSPAQAGRAAGAALPLLRRAAAGHIEQKTCFGCHNQGPPLLTLVAAERHGHALPDGFLAAQHEHIVAFVGANRAAFLAGRGTGGGVDTAATILLALEQAGHEPDEDSAAVAEYLLLAGAKKDHWACSSNRPPSEASHFATTYLALRGLRRWATPEQKVRAQARTAAARKWLERTPANDTEDRVFRALALALAGADEVYVRTAARDLLRTQRPDGGWAQLPGRPSDAYATGTALFALHAVGELRPTDPAYRHALIYLIGAQLPDGSWKVVSRSRPFQKYYESGFPHEKDQFISAPATAWAALALLRAAPEAVKDRASARR